MPKLARWTSAWLSGLLLVFTLLCFSLLTPSSALAAWTAPTGMKGWATVVGPGAFEYFATPDEACRRQKALYAPMSVYRGFRDTAAYNHIKQCIWTPVFGDSGASTVDLQCQTGYIRTPDGQCRNDPFACIGPCPANGGGSPTAITARPVDIITGVKQFRTNDFEDAAGHLFLNRVYASKRYGDFATPFRKTPIGLGNWQFDFQFELQISTEWASARRIAVATPDGRGLAFKRETSGAMSVYMDAPNPTPQTDYRLEFVGSWPGVLDNLANAQSTWKLSDAEDTVWVLQTFLDQISGKYDVARPVSRTTRDGLVWTFTYGSANQLTKIEDSYGKAITFTWLTGSWSGGAFPLAISEAVLPGGYKLVYSYSDVAGATAPISPDRLTKVELKTSAGVLLDATEYLYEDAVVPTFVTGVLDRDGVRRWTVDYDAYGRAIESTAPGGAFSTQIAYGALGTTFSRTATNALGKQTIYNFAQSAYGYSGRWTGAAGQASTHTPASTRSYAYGTNKLTSSMTDEEGRVTTYVRNARGLPTQVIEAFGSPSARTTTMAWHATFNVPTQIVQPGRTTNFTYDTAGRLVTRVETDTTTFTTPYTTNGRTRTWTYGWSTTGQLLTIDGPLAGTGDTITYAYDADGYLASVTNEVGQVTTITSVDWRGAPLTVEDANGVETVLTYDPRGRLLTATLDPGADQSVYVLAYNAVGDVAKLTLPGGGWLEYSYDDASRLTGIENDRGQTQVFVNNALGQPTSAQVKDAGATVTRLATFAYDELGRLLQSIGAGSQTTAFAYDKLSNLTRITDARSKIYGSSFDPLNRLITTTNPDSQTNQQTFNGQNDLTAFEDGRGLITSRKVDGFGRTIQETSPDRGTLSYWYDNRDNVTKIVDGDGVETVFTYDDADRRLNASFTGASGENVTYGYDSTAGGNKGVGRLTWVDDEPGSSAFTYDAQGRLTLDAKVIQGQSYAVGYGHDENGEVVSLILPSGRTVSLARGADGLISGITSKATPASAVETLASAVTWRPFGPLAGLTYGNGLSLTNGYDLNDWMSGMEVTDGAAVLDLTYGRNANGELTSVVDNAASGRAATYGYTNSGRLNLANGAWGNDTYAYDAAGNRSQMTRTISAVTTTWDSTIPGGVNRISDLENAASVVTRRLTYRTGGAITRDERVGGATYDYVYNARGRMISASKDSVLAGEYGYDAFGRRVWRETHGTGAVHIHYIFDPDGHLLAEHAATTGDVLREYVWLEDTPLAMFDYSGGAPATFFIHTGQIGEPLAVTNAARAKVWDAAIEPFGQAVMFGTASEALDLRLPGQWLQAETGGLFQNWMRDYDPTLGRDAQADPLGIEAGENLYGYALGSPLAISDPTGEIAPLIVGAVVGGGLDLISQLADNGGRLECVNWWRVGGMAALGSVGGAWAGGAFKLTNAGLKASQASFRYGTALSRYRKAHGIVGRDTHISHWLIDRRGSVGRHLPDWLKNSPWNLNPTSAAVNAYKNPLRRKLVSSPGWARVALGAPIGGAIGDVSDRDCSC